MSYLHSDLSLPARIEVVSSNASVNALWSCVKDAVKKPRVVIVLPWSYIVRHQ